MAAPDKLVSAVVSVGRTVSDGLKSFSSGDKVSLPADEILRLTNLGYLVNPDARAIETGNGPTFSIESGPGIKIA